MARPEIVETLKTKFVTYEMWVASGCPEPRPDSIPKEYSGLFNQSPDAYMVYRHALFGLIQHLSGKDAIIRDLGRLISKLESQHVGEFSRLLNFITSQELASRFEAQWANVFAIQREIAGDQISPQWLHLYQSKYEIDEILLFLAMLKQLLRGGVVNLDMKNLRDSKGSLRRGVTVDFISSGLADYPELRTALDTAYKPKLRNTIGHNKYRIEGSAIKSLDGTISVSREEFVRAVYSMQELQNAVLFMISQMAMRDRIWEVRDCGIASMAFGFRESTEEPALELFQLWCFYSLDNEKTWLNQVGFRIENGTLRTTFTPRAFFVGPIPDVLKNWLEAVKSTGTVLAKVSSVIPFIGNEDRRIELKWGTFQSTGDEHEKTLSVVDNNFPGP